MKNAVFLLYMKMSDKTTYYRKNREIILNRAEKILWKQQKSLREQARNKYRELSEKEKEEIHINIYKYIK